MGRKKTHTPEEIVAKLRQAEVSVGQGKTVADVVRAIRVLELTYYRW
jgi:putative transposase